MRYSRTTREHGRSASAVATLAAGLALSLAAAAPVWAQATAAGQRGTPAASAATTATAARKVGSPVFTDIPGLIEDAIAQADKAVAAIIAVPDEKRTFENTLGAIDDLLARLDGGTNMAQFMAYVSTDAAERDASNAAQLRIESWMIDLSKNEDLYHAVKAYASTDPKLSGERARLLEHTLRDYRRAGMELPKEQRDKLTEIEKTLSELAIQFQTNIREDETVVAVTRDELAGVPEEFINSRSRTGDLYVITMDYPSVDAVWKHCTVETTREKVRFAYARRGGQKNVRLLERILKLRDEHAGMLGYDSTVDYVVETRMAKNDDTVAQFYEDLIPIVRKKAEKDYAELTQAKRQDTGDANAVVEIWDRNFYEDYLLRTKYNVDSQEVRQYFPLQAVLDGLFSITQSLYGIEYRDVTDSAGTPDRPLWHEDVKLYEVYDRKTGEMLGSFYIDLFPRDNKYNHAAQWGLRQHKVYMDGTEQKPLAALVCNFTKPTADKPSLMQHDEVETFFHEFGHCLHTILSEADLQSFAGTSVERDFVEAPSQMFENWVWDADVLATFARHYQTGKPLPRDLLDRMISARHLNSGLWAMGQIWLGKIDNAYHTAPGGEIDTTAVQLELSEQLLPYPPMPETWFQAAFGHLMGYQAGYYGYMWSLVYASDMFQRFKELGMLDPDAGRYYREKILARGGTMDGMDMVRDYLGREPDMSAFLKHLGLEE
ncbi:MAG: Zn-dependent oligopeptidase [Phycisphaerales bacterium]|nr:Zn-dependent oligopeptidase [Phycisphaerales bacterium]